MRVGLGVWFDPERVEAIEHDNLSLHREVYAWWVELARLEREAPGGRSREAL